MFELVQTIGTSIEMIERYFGSFLDGSASVIASKMAAFERQSRCKTRSAFWPVTTLPPDYIMWAMAFAPPIPGRVWSRR